MTVGDQNQTKQLNTDFGYFAKPIPNVLQGTPVFVLHKIYTLTYQFDL